MPPAAIEDTMPKTASCAVGSRRFGDLRGVQWRLDLGILPSTPSASIDDLRRVTANSRRRYAALRKQLLVDPHVPKDGSNSPDLAMDNPLSQNPDSMWSRFFRNAALERMVDQDLTRLYPQRGSYFQTSGCQCMLRRILLLWCLRHPEIGYRQGMHELLAPLLYALQVDVEHLSEVRKAYEEHFADKFDGFSYQESALRFKFDFKKFSESVGERNEFEDSSAKASSLMEVDPEIQTIVLLSDAYGAEGELGVVLSEKFMEHDAYSMFDALMSGAGGVVAMAEFFSPSYASLHTRFAPVIEASAAIYHLLSVVDSSLHTHLVELGIEPQYFSLRWLRLLFGREFYLEDLLVIWDEIFACDNTKTTGAADRDAESNFGVLDSLRGAFVSAFAVSMILELRSSLLATENATACLQRLLNFPEDVNLVELVAKAKSLQALAVDANNTNSLLHPGLYGGRRPVISRGHSLLLNSGFPEAPRSLVPESYWEERWRVLHREEQHEKGAVEEQVPIVKKGWSEKVRLRLSRTASEPSPSKENEKANIPKPSVRKSLLDDLAQQLGSDEDKENTESADAEHQDSLEVNEQGVTEEKLSSTFSVVGSEENYPNFSNPPSPMPGNSGQENKSGSSSVASNSFIDEIYAESCGTHHPACPSFPVSHPPAGISSKCNPDNDSAGKSATGMKERKVLPTKFQWLWKFGQSASDGASDRPGPSKSCNREGDKNNTAGSTVAGGYDSSPGTSKGETVDQNLIVSLRSLGQSMLENIQVIESVFQQDPCQMEPPENFKHGLVGEGQVIAMRQMEPPANFKHGLVGEGQVIAMRQMEPPANFKHGLVEEGQVTAMSALKELRKIGDFLSGM